MTHTRTASIESTGRGPAGRSAAVTAGRLVRLAAGTVLALSVGAVAAADVTLAAAPVAAAPVAAAPVAAMGASAARGCGTHARIQQGAGGSVTVIVGDSLTVGEWCYGSAAKLWSGQVVVDAKVGRGTVEGLAVATKLARGAGRVVLALGTNDAAGAKSEHARVWERRVRQFVRANPGVEVWLVRIVVPGRAKESFNAAVGRLDEEANVSVVEWVPKREHLSRDGVHLWGDGANGYRERAKVVARAVQG